MSRYAPFARAIGIALPMLIGVSLIIGAAIAAVTMSHDEEAKDQPPVLKARFERGTLTPLGAVHQTIERLEYEQATEGLASDRNARALVHMMQARSVLAGEEPQETEDGFPIIQ